MFGGGGGWFGLWPPAGLPRTLRVAAVVIPTLAGLAPLRCTTTRILRLAVFFVLLFGAVRLPWNWLPPIELRWATGEAETPEPASVCAVTLVTEPVVVVAVTTRVACWPEPTVLGFTLLT